MATGEEKNSLLNNDAFVCTRVCMECCLRLPLGFAGVPKEGQQQRAAPAQLGGCSDTGMGQALAVPKQEVSLLLCAIDDLKGIAVVVIQGLPVSSGRGKLGTWMVQPCAREVAARGFVIQSSARQDLPCSQGAERCTWHRFLCPLIHPQPRPEIGLGSAPDSSCC